MSDLRGTFTVKFYTTVDMTLNEFVGQLDSFVDFDIVDSYYILDL